MPKLENKKDGISIIGVLFLGVIIILILSYFNISIRVVVESPVGQDNIQYVGGAGKSLWNDYLKKPVSYFWNDIWIPLIWKSFVSNMGRIRDGLPTDFQLKAPQISY